MTNQSSTDTFSWIGGGSGNWTQPSDWFDLTTGNTGTVVPGTGSDVIVNGTSSILIGGTGASGTLAVIGAVSLDGAFNFGTVDQAAGSSLSLIGPGSTHATVSIGDLVQSGTADSLYAVNSDMTVVVGSLGPVVGTISAVSLGQVILPSSVAVAGGTLEVGGLSASMIIGNPGTFSSPLALAYTEVAQGATLSGYGSLYGNMDYAPPSGGLSGLLTYDGIGLVVNGLIESAGFTVYGILAGSGTIDVLANGSFTAAVTNAAANNLTFNIGSNATLHVSSTPDAYQQINFAGPGGIAAFYEDDYKERYTGLPLMPNLYLFEAAPINGFAPGDRLLTVIDPGSALLAPTFSGGRLSFNEVNNTGITAAYFTLNGAYSASRFLPTIVPDYLTTGSGAIDLQIDMLPAAGYALSAGSGAGDTFTWVGLSAGAWGDAANWYDVTRGAAATVAPGAGDVAIINGGSGYVYMVVTQSGSVGALVAEGHVAIEGTVTAGTIETAAGASLLVTNGGTLIGNTISIAPGGLADADGGSPGQGPGLIDITGTATVASGAVLVVADGGRMQAGGLVTQGGDGTTNTLQIDPGSGLTVGTLNDAAAGELRIDPGAVFTDTSPAGNQVRLAGTLADNGTLIASNIWVNTLGGTGTIDVIPNGVLAVVNLLPETLTFNVASGGVLTLDEGAPATPIEGTINLTGSNDSIYFGIDGSLGNLFMPATLSGFAAGDSLEIELNLYPQYVLNPIISADFIQTNPNSGTVSFLDGNGVQVGGIAAAGSYAPGSLIVTRNDFSNYNVNVTVAETGFVPSGSVDASGGTFTFTGPSGGNWADPANWTQSTGGHPAQPPGAADSVTMGAGSNGLTVLAGTGAAKTWTLDSYNPAIAGRVTVGTIVAADSFSGALYDVFLDAGGTLAAGILSVSTEFDPAFRVDGPGALLTIGTLAGESFYGAAYTYEPGGIIVENGGTASVGALSYSIFLPNISSIGSGAFPFQLDGGGTMILPTAVGSATTPINMTGTNNVLGFDSPTATSLSVTPSIGGFADSDIVDVTFAPTNAQVVFSQNGTLSETAAFQTAGGAALGSLTFSGNFDGHTFHAQALAPNETQIVLDATCFREGTRLSTDAGEVAVEDLRMGDIVMTQAGRPVPVRWIGRRRIDCTRHPNPDKVWPVRIRRGAFGRATPRHDLFLSPNHAVFIDNVLVPIKHLVNEHSITQVEVETVSYYHVELPAHDVLLAEGLPAESYLDTGDRHNFENGGLCLALYPDLAATRWELEGYAPLVISGAQLDRIRTRLARRASNSRRRTGRAANPRGTTVA